MESQPSRFTEYFENERHAVTGEAERRIAKLEKRVQRLREQSASDWRAALAEKAEELRQQGEYVGGIECALLHYYGADLQDEVISELGSWGNLDENWASFIEFATRLQQSEGLVPVIINSPQYVLYRDGSSEWREYVFVLADSEAPFYARRYLFAESGDILPTTEYNAAVREMKSFGIRGSFTSVDTSEEERSIGGIYGRHVYVSGGNPELITSDNQLKNGEVVTGMYREQGRYKSKITTFGSRAVQYTLEWQEVEDLIYAESAGDRRNAAARKVGAYLLTSDIEPEEVMPRAGKIVNAIRALDSATAD